MKLLRNLILSLGVIFAIVSCGNTTKQSNNDITLGSSMKVSYEMTATAAQIDSICIADTLPSFSQWKVTNFVDYETGTKNVKRICLKEYNSGNEVIYIVLGAEQPYKVTRRIIE